MGLEVGLAFGVDLGLGDGEGFGVCPFRSPVIISTSAPEGARVVCLTLVYVSSSSAISSFFISSVTELPIVISVA